MRVVIHNLEAQEYASHLLTSAHADPITETLAFRRWIASRLEWEMEGIIEALQVGEPVRGFNPSNSESIDAWAN